jgi:hypothetical protein
VGYDVTVDSDGNVYMCGEYRTSQNLSLGNSVILYAPPAGSGFLIKYNSGGTPQWAKLSPQGGSTLGVTMDSSGNIYAVGYYISNGFQISIGSGKYLPNTGSTQDPFIIKYFANGGTAWGNGLGTDISSEASAVSTDSSGNVFMVGKYGASSSIALGNGQYLTSAPNNSAFLVKYNSSGVAQWGKNIGGSGNYLYGKSTVADSNGNVYITGRYSSSSGVSLGNSVTLPIVSSGLRTFVIKYNTSGTAQWSKMINTSSTNYNNDAAIDSSGNVYLTGYYNSSSSLSLGNNITLPATPHMDAYVIVYDTSGTAQGVINVSGTSSLTPGINPSGIAVDSNGNIIVGGSMSMLINSALDIGNSVSLTRSTTHNPYASYDDIGFVIKYATQSSPNKALLVAGNAEVGTANLFVDTATSRVGVGTATPGYSLDVTGDINFTGALTQNGTAYGGSSSSGEWIIVNTNEIHYSLGNVGIGLSNPNYDLDVAGNINFTGALTQNGTTYGGSSSSGGEWVIVNTNEIHYSLGNVGIGLSNPNYPLHVSGDIYATGNVTAYSDKRKKTNLQIISDALNKVSNLNGYTYEKDGTKYTGLIAQEVLEVLPEAVVGNEEDGYGLAYGNMVGILVEAIKELTNEVKNLKEKLYS